MTSSACVRFVIARREGCKAGICFVAIGDDPPVHHRPHLSSPGHIPSPNRYSALTHYGVPAISEDRVIGEERVIGREDVDSAPALPPRSWFSVGVGSGPGPGLTSESADAVRAVLITICRPGPSLWHLPALPV